MPSLHVAAAHILSRAKDTEGNFARLQRQVEAAAVFGVRAMLFAETCLHSYDIAADSIAQAEPLMAHSSPASRGWPGSTA